MQNLAATASLPKSRGSLGQPFEHGVKALLGAAANHLFGIADGYITADVLQRTSQTQSHFKSDAELPGKLPEYRQSAAAAIPHDSLDQSTIHRTRRIAFADRKTKTDATGSAVQYDRNRGQFTSESDCCRIVRV